MEYLQFAYSMLHSMDNWICHQYSAVDMAPPPFAVLDRINTLVELE
jgi:hypothetical protein